MWLERYVFVVDTSGSMKCHETALKNYLKTLIDAFTMWGTSVDDMIALVSFSNDVYIESYYDNQAAELKNKVNALDFFGGTALNDGILVGLTFENPKPDYFFVFSDGGDNVSDAKVEHYENVKDHLNIVPIMVPPSDDTYKGDCRYSAYYTIAPITVKMAVANVEKLAKRLKGKVILRPEDLLKLKPANEEKLTRALIKRRRRRVK